MLSFFLLSLALTLAGLTLLWVRKPAFVRSLQQPVWYAGSVVAACCVALAYFALPLTLWTGLLVATLLIVIIGWYDERHALSPWIQLMFQIAIVLSVVLAGWTISYVTSPFGHGLLYLAPLVGGGLAVIWLLAVINALNWFDGIDGLAGSMSAVAFAALALISLMPATRDPQTLRLALIGLGAALAFLVWNWSPARLYLGTTGSWFLGLFLGVVALAGQGKIAITMLVLAIPLLDALFVIIRRVASGHKPWIGDQQHVHHRLKNRGFSDRSIALLCILVSSLLLAAGLLFSVSRQGTCPDFSQSEITLQGVNLSVAVAATPNEQAQGLSGCPAVPDSAGELFVFDPPRRPSFWMKDMLIPLDIVWLKEGQIVGVERNVPPPAPGTPDSLLPLYSPPEAVDAALEIGAGKAEEYGF